MWNRDAIERNACIMKANLDRLQENGIYKIIDKELSSNIKSYFWAVPKQIDKLKINVQKRFDFELATDPNDYFRSEFTYAPFIWHKSPKK